MICHHRKMKQVPALSLIGFALLVSSMFTACSTTGETGTGGSVDTGSSSAAIKLPTESPGIRGVITKADSSAGSSNILVEENPADASGSNKASVRIKDQTKIYRREGGRLENSSASALTVGKQVSVWFEGPVAESYPVQGSASIVVIEE